MEREIVRDGYEVVAAEYTAARHIDPQQLSFLEDLVNPLPRSAQVLDAGCGAGVPITQWLHEHCIVTGVDIAEEQIRRLNNTAALQITEEFRALVEEYDRPTFQLVEKSA